MKKLILLFAVIAFFALTSDKAKATDVTEKVALDGPGGGIVIDTNNDICVCISGKCDKSKFFVTKKQCGKAKTSGSCAIVGVGKC